MQTNGQPDKTLLKELQLRLEGDFTYSSGRIVGSMCTAPHPIARKAYVKFLEKNLGDSGLFPAVAELETETIKMLGTLLSNPNASGHILTGGTEANLLALWTAKKLSKKDRGEVIVPVSAHFSFDKVADILSLKLIKVELNEHFQVNVEAVKKAVNPRTIAIVGVAGTTGLGMVDPIDELSEIALEKNLYLHVDGAFGGFVLPFLKEIGYHIPNFDFSVQGVSSITVDPHKMGLAAIPAGGIIYKTEDLKKTVSWDVAYLSGGETEQATLAGTRSGASAIAVWAVMKHLGRQGYMKVVRKCMNLTFKLAEEIPKIHGLDIVTKPTMNIIGIRTINRDVQKIAKKLRLRKWAIALFPQHIRIVVMPHVKKQHIDELLQDLSGIVNESRV
jgi:tyrosine decarboxylase/aspartate 1-decarboxylase